MQPDIAGRLCPGVGGRRELTLPTRKDRLLLAYLALIGRPAVDAGPARRPALGRPRRDAGARQPEAVPGRPSVRRSGRSSSIRSPPTGIRDLRSGRHRDRRRRVCAAGDERSRTARPLALYSGALLEGIDGVTPEFDEWLGPERQRLAALAVRVLEQLSHVTGTRSDEAVWPPAACARSAVRAGLSRPDAPPCRRGDRTAALKLYAPAATP